MRYTPYLLAFTILFSCSKSIEQSSAMYYSTIHEAERAICDENFKRAIIEFEEAFDLIEKPFGKDIFNAALVSQLIEDYEMRDHFLQQIINNSDEWDFVKSVFVTRYMTEQEWERLTAQRTVKYNETLRDEFDEIHARDQLFRPMYETHDDTINANRKINLKRILDIAHSEGFPSHMELGYSSNLRSQPHDIVLHHTAQRRSYDKTVIDLEPVLKAAVNTGRFDPEKAIFYLNFQNDSGKGKFEVYSSWQYTHPLLPDGLNQKIWFPKLDEAQMTAANELRKQWHANSLADITTKANFLNTSGLPFIFSSVKKSIAKFPDDFDQETALYQYEAMTTHMIEKKN